MTTQPIDIVRWAVAAFHANPDATHPELTALLRAAGIAHADRAVTMLPLAYGRRILDGIVSLPATFRALGADGKTTRELPFADDQIFAAAERIARDAPTSEDLHRIGLTSAELEAVNKALHAGARAENLALASPIVSIDDAGDAAITPAPDAQVVLDRMLQDHGSSLAAKAAVYPRALAPGRAQLQIDIVAHAGARPIVESFSGLGTTVREAIAEAFGKFARGSLHVLLATLESRALGADQVDWESWDGFEICIGPLLRLWSDEAPLIFGDFLDAVRARLRAAPPSREVHWLRTFVAVAGDKVIGFEMLLDNEPWEPGIDLIKSWPWPAADHRYALRHFMMLIP